MKQNKVFQSTENPVQGEMRLFVSESYPQGVIKTWSGSHWVLDTPATKQYKLDKAYNQVWNGKQG